MPPTLAAVADPGALAAAWRRTLDNDRSDDVLSSGVRRFELAADEHLAKLGEALRDGSYRPRPLTVVEIPKDDGEVRVLLVPPVVDRIVERSVLAVLTPVIDPLLGPGSFAYRPGLGVVDTVQALALLRDEGFDHVLRADVDDCFPSIDLHRVRRLVHHLIDDPPLRALLDLLLDRRPSKPTRTAGRAARGLPQGSPLSPLLANLVLEHVDDRLRGAGFPVVRYADDLAIAAKSREDAWEAGRLAATAVEEIDMTLGAAEVMSFVEGFTFLGEEFGPRYPPVVDNRTRMPERRTVYLGVTGSRARIDEGRIVVEHEDETLLDIPAGLVARVVCFGPVAVSAGLRNWALASGIDMVFCSRRGSYLGQTISGHTGRVERLRRQLAVSESPERYLPVARAIVEAKIRKQAVLLRHLMRKESARELAEAVGMMQGYADMLPQANDRSEVMGLEGAAARAYFQAWTAVVDAAFRFTGRNRHPPLDVVNSALSFGYAVLLSEATSALAAAGLDPAIGLLHSDAEGRPSLALDLVEEFRPLIVDQVVMELLRRPTHRRSRPRRRTRWRSAPHRRRAHRAPRRIRAAHAPLYPRLPSRLRRNTAPPPIPTSSSARRLHRRHQPGYVGLSWR